jgi:hypothetical protein
VRKLVRRLRVLKERFTKLSINQSWVNIDQVSYWFQIPTNPLSKESFPRARHLELLGCPCLVRCSGPGLICE